VALVLVLVAPLFGPVERAAAAPGCPNAQVPPPPAAVEETRAAAPAPLPWAVPPVGGAAMGACGDVVAPAAPPVPPEVTAAGFVLADLDTGAVLAARAPHGRQRPASTLKVLTALVAIDRLDRSTPATTRPRPWPGRWAATP
jgi:D-alanyl-D-alanine carboxypeptidase (penicillin-binding protein 5/6)